MIKGTPIVDLVMPKTPLAHQIEKKADCLGEVTEEKRGSRLIFKHSNPRGYLHPHWQDDFAELATSPDITRTLPGH